jgi:hypothetical protein
MPNVTQNSKDALEEAARQALSTYNFFEVTDGEQAPLAGLAALRALFVARVGPDQVYVEEQRRYIEDDWDFAIQVLGLIDTDVSNANTKLAMQQVFTAFVPGLDPTYISQVHRYR